jgi:type II secretory pathway pseudopilin PulG
MGRSMRSGRPRAVQAGFAYLILLLAIALIGLAAATAVQLGATMARRDAEQQLLAIGAEFEQALRSYAGVPAGARWVPAARGPRTLEELLRDPRVPGVRRHLRQIYADPMRGKAEWGLIYDAQGFIVGVHSLAEGKPIKSAGWPATWTRFEEAKTYRDWVFGLHP